MTERKKILWLCSWYPSPAQPFNGDFIQRHAQAAALHHDLHIIHVSGNATHEQNKLSNTIPGLTEQIILYKNSRGPFRKLLNHFKWSSLYKKTIRNYVIENGKPDLVHVHIPMKAGLMAQWVNKVYKVPYVVSEHWGIYNNQLDERFTNKPGWFKKLITKTFTNATAALSVSQYLADNIRRLVTTNIQFEVIGNVVNTDLFFLQENKTNRFRFIHVSNMVSLKNVEGILFAFADLLKSGVDAELVLVGGDYYSQEQTAADLGLLNKSVFFRGEISYEKVAVEIQQSHSLVLFSNIENSPCVIGEALCCGLPVIATAVGGIPELVDAKNGKLVEAGDVKSLTDEMKQMAAGYSRYNRQQIADTAKELFSYPVIGNQFAGFYQKIFDKNRKLEK